MPYNDWPILRVDVHEGQRLTWHRENGTWVGDNDVLTTQFETPAEIDGTIEAVELSKTELEGVRSKAELAKLQAESDFEQSKIRETNAKQELDRISNLNKRDAESLESHHRAENLWKLAVVERSRAEKIVHLQNQLTDSEIRVAEGKLVQARSELDLANFKRDMSWGKVPVHLIKGSPDHPKQVVVTRVSTAIGDQPPRNGAPPVWVELVDDSRLFVRTLIDEEIDRTVKPGTPVRFTQKDRKFHGHVVATLPVVDPETQKIQVLLEVENPDRVLRLGSKIGVSFENSHQ
jgi:multidrug efflux pump subunit AcrA (membrane-fusion protein)